MVDSTFANREDLAFLQRIAMLPRTGTIADRNRLIRCARTVARALRSEDDTAEIALEPAPAREAPAERVRPILGPGER